jgi:hypothetical protein
LLPAFRYTPDQVRALVHGLPLEAWHYLGSDGPYRLALEEALADRIPWLSVAEPLDRQSRQLRQPFLDLMGTLAVRNASPSWWSSGLAAKGPYASQLFLKCCFLAVGRELLGAIGHGCHLVVAEGSGLVRRLAALAADAGTQVRFLAPPRGRLLRLAGQGHAAVRTWRNLWVLLLRRRAVLRQHGMLAVQPLGGLDTALLFAWVDRRNFAPDGSYCEPHFGDPLPRHLRSRGYRLAYVTRVLDTIPFEEAVLRLKATNEVCIFPEALLTPSDMLGAIRQVVLYRPVLPRPLCLDGLDITELVEEQVGQDVAGGLPSLLYARIVHQLARRGITPGLLFYTMEGQGWERVLCQAVRTYLPMTKVVACNTGTFSSMLLSMQSSREELTSLPLPDRIVTNGPQMELLLRAVGYPHVRVFAGAALRHDYLWERPALRTRPARHNVAHVLVATEIDLGRSIELVDKALRALAGRQGYQVTVKCHPMVDSRQVVAAVGERGRAANVRFSASPVSECLSQANVLLYTYTSVCFEALRHGVVPVFVRAEGWLNMDELEHAPDCRWVATSPQEIRETVEEVLGLSDDAWWRWYHRAQHALARHLAPMTPELIDRCVDSHPAADPLPIQQSAVEIGA